MWKRGQSDARQAKFLAAAKRGDLEAVQAHFKQPDVLADVVRWNNELRAQRLGLDEDLLGSLLPRPWFDGVERGKTLFATNIVYHGQVEIFRWFFSSPQIELMEDTLRALAPQIARACLFAQIASSFDMAEILFESPLFAKIMGRKERRSLLGELVCLAASRGFDEWVSVLLAHGADPNYKRRGETPITALADQGDTKTLDALLSHGSWLEGEESVLVLSVVARNEQLVADLLQRGADSNFVSNHYYSALHEAARLVTPNIVGRLALEGFADIDARDEDGRTPLMIVASGGNGYRNVQSKIQTIELLLDCGADTQTIDSHQCGVLHYVMCDPNEESVRLFLDQGLDPNQQDAAGQTPVGTLLFHARHGIRDRIAGVLDLLLQAGADPYMFDNSGVSAAEILETSESGRAFIAARHQHFHQHQRSVEDESPLN